MNKILCTCLLAVSAVCFTAVDAKAQTYDLLFSQDDYSVFEGGTVDLTLLLRETVTGGQTARLAAGNDDGLFTWGVNVDFDTVSSGARSFVGSTSDVAINAIFDDTAASGVDLLGNSVDVTAATADPAGIDGTDLGGGIFELELATFTVTAGDLGSVTTFALADHTNAAVDTIFGDATLIDTVANYGSASVTVVAIPEPATASLLLLGATGMLVRRRKMA